MEREKEDFFSGIISKESEGEKEFMSLGLHYAVQSRS
jgi:hypothetical protein